jgi:phosphohistidine phosphatase SixA
MHLTIVRHAHAGHKREWTGPDLERPLDDLGRRQTAALTELLDAHVVSRIVSSPAVRCLQTVAALAERLDVAVETWLELGPDGSAGRVADACFGDPAYADAVLCTHGEVLAELLRRPDIARAVGRRGPGRDALLTKGSAWRLGVRLDGTVSNLAHLLPG